MLLYYLNLRKNDDPRSRKRGAHYQSLAKDLGIEMLQLNKNHIELTSSNNRTIVKYKNNELPTPDVVIDLTRNKTISQFYGNKGIWTLNSQKVINICNNKVITNALLAGTDICLPKTFYGSSYEALVKEVKSPFVLKEIHGLKGDGVFLINNKEEFDEVHEKYNQGQLLAQEYIKTSAGASLRIYSIGGKALIGVKRKTTNGDFRANISQGAVTEPYPLDDKIREICKIVHEKIGGDVLGIDLMFGENGEYVFCEANASPAFRSAYMASNKDLFKEILKYVKEKY